MTEPHKIEFQMPRRRVLRIAALASLGAVLPGMSLLAAQPDPMRWRGTALGIEAAITLYHPNHEHAERLIAECVEEVRQLEAVFSLFDPASALSRLNRIGYLDRPPAELVAVMRESQRLGELTGGAFDMTVQPLWQLYVRHFDNPGADPAGPSAADVDRARTLIDFRSIQVASNQIRYPIAGQAITLNGIAQGFITDRVAERLKSGGMNKVLVDMGEFRGIGRHPDGRPWRIGLRDPLSPGALSRTIDLDDRAAASSGGYGTRFDATGRHHHLFDPKTGASARLHAGVTVLAPSATLADGLSTGFSALSSDRIRAIINQEPGISVILTDLDGAETVLSS